jgi:DNA-binding winged helix-turn-helix (wHTH) protein/tetratricopeptide (TPR) repeat protein
MADRHTYEFGQFRLDPTEHLLLRDGVPVPLTEKTFQVLLVLASRSGHLIEKSELVTAVWGDSFIEEGNLTVTISMLRKALGDDRNQNKFIETIAKQGYRFLPSVTRVSDGVSEAPKARGETSKAAVETPTAPRLVAAAHSARVGGTALVVVLGIIAVISVRVYSRVQASGSTGRDIFSMAVVPFDVTGSDHAGLDTGASIAGDLISMFGKSNRIEVRPATAVMKYVGGGESPSSIGREQKVDMVLTGTVEIERDHAHVTAKLFGSDGETIWAGTYDRALTQIHDLEDQIQAEATKSMFGDREPLPKPTEASHDPEAYQLYVEGRYFWNKRTEKGFRRSIECFQQAILKDPAYAEAYAGLADSYTLLASYGVEPPVEAYPNAKAAAMKALKLNAGLSDAHTSLGMVALYYEWNWGQADREFRRAIDLNPNYSGAHAWDSLYLAAMGDTDEALRQAQWAQELDPLSLAASMDLGSVYYWGRQYDKAVSAYKRAITLDPYFARAHSRLGMVLAAEKDYSGAIREFQETSKLSGPDPYLDGLIGYAQALRGNPKVARRIVAALTERSHHEYVPGFSMALLYVGLGDRDEAINWLGRAYQDRSTYMIFAKVDPLLDPLRSDPRFVSLLKRMDLPELRAENNPTQALDSPASAVGTPH